MLKDWPDEYLVGIEEIDHQHKGFFEAAQGMYDGILNCEGQKVAEDSVAFLKDYANRHFRAEEAFMEKHRYPGIEQHKKLHAKFFEALDMLVDDLQVLGPSQRLADRALEISQDWLVHHIAEEDAQYVTYVKKRS